MTPGPSLAVVLGSTARGGHPAGLAAALAHGLAVWLYAVLTVAGLAALLTASPKRFALLQLAAAGYLVYLARSALRQQAPITTAETDARRHRNLGAAARDGFMIAFLNPKLAVFMLALFAPFVTWRPAISRRRSISCCSKSLPHPEGGVARQPISPSAHQQTQTPSRKRPIRASFRCCGGDTRPRQWSRAVLEGTSAQPEVSC